MKYFIVIVICFAVCVAGLTGYRIGQLDASVDDSIYYTDGHLNGYNDGLGVGYKKGIGECADLCSLAFAKWWDETNITVTPRKVEK